MYATLPVSQPSASPHVDHTTVAHLSLGCTAASNLYVNMDMSDDGMNMDMSMSMSFSFTCDVGELLFGWWTINTCLAFYLSCIPVIILSCLRHWAYHVATSAASSPKGVSASRTTSLLDDTSSGGRVV